MKPATYLRSEDAAIYLGFVKDDGTANLPAFKKWAQRVKVKTYRIGKRALRYRQVDLDSKVEVASDGKRSRQRRAS